MSRCALLIGVLSLLAAPSPAAAITIPVLADASVYSSNPNGNYGATTYQGGLFSGQTSGAGRFFLKFQLPALVPGTVVTSATLTGTYTFDLLAPDTVHGIHLVADDSWTEAALTWSNQPIAGVVALATWDAATAPAPPVSQSFQSFALTTAVNAQYQTDGVLSLMFRALDEGPAGTFEYWSAKEYGDQPGFSLDVTIAPVPEPGTAGLLALGLLGLGRRGRRRLRRRAAATRSA